MNKKAQQYQEKSNKLLWFIFILIVVAGLLYYFGKLGAVTGGIMKIGSNIFGGGSKNEVATPTPVQLSNEIEWCKMQSISTGDDLNNPSTNTIRGYDTLHSCCLQEFLGWSSCENKEVKLEICYSSQIGGSLIYSRYNGYYLRNALTYKTILGDIHKTNVTNVCNSNAFSEVIK